MATGKVKKLIRDRGFGFITTQDGAEVFFHRNAVQGAAFDSLTEGQAVTFDTEQGEKGPRAANVRIASDGG